MTTAMMINVLLFSTFTSHLMHLLSFPSSYLIHHFICSAINLVSIDILWCISLVWWTPPGPYDVFGEAIHSRVTMRYMWSGHREAHDLRPASKTTRSFGICSVFWFISASNRFCTKNVTETSSFSIHFFHHTRISFLHAMTVCALMYRIIWLYNVCILTLFILYTHWYFSFSKVGLIQTILGVTNVTITWSQNSVYVKLSLRCTFLPCLCTCKLPVDLD